ncbi:hypothetical protein HUW62_35185 [Myxococcus sp. AM011]|uniref:hypothetical protein n=1 Tax=Myxococcus sp. AM011 TaxID=2745200 RepID=UPI001595DA79|nr:hypothetical protein [Myxococcus sp. AM011]NVJ26477.1 hypothetical protein [Myxococcus sp. AM011]
MTSAPSSTPPAPTAAPRLTRGKAVVASGVLFVVSCTLPAIVAYNTGTLETESTWGVSIHASPKFGE